MLEMEVMWRSKMAAGCKRCVAKTRRVGDSNCARNIPVKSR